MQRQVPSVGRILTMAIFVLSCFGLLLYLWVAFGGAIPFKPKGYRFKAEFTEASQLAQESDVRISGVNVGKVKSLKLEDSRAVVEMEIDSKYAPVPSDSRVTLRQKTLAGETYVELTPGSARVAKLPDNGTLPAGNVSPSVEFDELLQAFDEPTRKAFQVWMENGGAAAVNRGPELNDAFGYLPQFTESGNTLVTILDEQNDDLRKLVQNGSEVFGALSERDGELATLISNLNRIFRATAERNREFAETFVVFPTFLRESRKTFARVKDFARFSDPTLTEFRPVAREMSRLFVAGRQPAADLRGFIENLGPLITASRKGLPALAKILDETQPLLEQFYPFLRNFNPLVIWLGQYKREIAAVIANLAVATEATDASSTGAKIPAHFLRVLPVLNPEGLAPAASNRLPTNRPNPYNQPGGLAKIGSPALQVFENRQCTGAALPTLDAGVTTDPTVLNEEVRTLILDLGPVAAPCDLQANFGFQGQSLHFPHVSAQ